MGAGSLKPFGYFFICGALLVGIACQSAPPPIEPPRFEYRQLAERYFRENLDGQFPLTIQRGANLHPSVAGGKYMFYTSNRDGSGDIWMRDLENTVNIAVVQHPSEQYKAAIPAQLPEEAGETYLAFVSEDLDSSGDLRIASADPRQYVTNTLNGLPPSELWEESYNLSDEIRAYAEALPVICRGEAAETDPAWSPDGKLLAFASDRCTSGEYNVWIMPMQNGRPLQAPQRISQNGGVRPSFGPEGRRIAYLGFGREYRGGSVLVYDRETQREKRARLPERGEAGLEARYFSPGIGYDRSQTPAEEFGTNANSAEANQDESRELMLFYASVRRDANGNGRIDDSDRAGLYRMPLAVALGEREAERRGPALDAGASAPGERQLLDDNANILSLAYSDFIGGALLYAAEFYNSVNVYFLRPEGVVPREKNIAAQYAFARRYREESERRYLLALDAVRQHFGETPEYSAYEGRLLLDRLGFFERRGEARLIAETRAAIATASRNNPYVETQREALQAADAGRNQLPIYAAFEARLETNRELNAYTPEQRAAVHAHVLHRLADLHIAQERPERALETITRLNRTYPQYHQVYQTRFLQGKLELRLQNDLPPEWNALLSEAETPPRVREDITAALFDFFYTERTPIEALEIVSRELQRDDLQQLVRASLQLVEARALFEEKRYAQALVQSNQLRQQIPTVVVNGSPQPAEGWRNIYVRVWQILSYVHERLGNYNEAYSAKLTYGGAYTPDTNVAIQTEDFLEIIEESEASIRLYLRSARQIARSVREEENQILGGAAGLVLDDLSGATTNIGGAELDVLIDFCNPSSRNSTLFLLLGPRYQQSYKRFCTTNEARLRERNYREFPLDEAREAAELLYSASFANGNVLNLMFLNMRKLGVLEELYRERAVFYQRQKINIAAERNRLALENEEKELLLISQSDVTNLFQQQDPYKSDVYNELISVYSQVLPEASQAGDLSMIYGYAYALIKKNVEKEAFYERLQERAYAEERGLTGAIQSVQPLGRIALPPDLLRAKKEEVLRDFKNAEYLLEYVLNVDPRNTDAYLLLGWLYQYLDERQTDRVQTVPTLLEEVYYFLSDTDPTLQTDSQFYSDLYRIYFPENFYEQNVELYRQATDKITPRNAAGQDLAALNLNLANNYFKLLNFRRAVEHYRLSAEQRERSGGGFADYRQNALFHFNLGRALFYDGRPEDAASELLRAYEIYDEFERKPLHERFSALNFAMRADQDEAIGQRESQRVLRLRMQALVDDIEEVRAKMALIAALVGLARWEAGRYDEAILFYRDAEFRLYGGEQSASPPPEGAVDRASLMNFIALAYQSKGAYAESDERAQTAGLYARDEGLRRADEAFQPQTLGGKALGCVLPYGEDFSVVGEGRNPNGFSPLRQYELSLGIQLENRILQGDLEGASYLLRQRRQVFQTRDFDVRLGRLGFVATMNQEAMNSFRARNYEESAETFRKAADEARGFAFLDSFRRNFSNQFKARFASYENPRADAGEALESIASGLEEIKSFRDAYREQVLQQFIAERRQEIPDYEYDPEVDAEALNQRVNRQLLDIGIVEATLLFYRAHLRRRVAQNAADLRAAYEAYGDAVNAFDGALQLLTRANQTGGVRGLRLKLNRARALRGAGRLLESRAQLVAAMEQAYEFNLIFEEWFAAYQLAEIEAELFATHGRPEDRRSADGRYRRALELLHEHKHLYARISAYADLFFDGAVEFYLQLQRDEQALRLLEWQWEFHLHWQFFRTPLRFPDPAYQQRYDSLRGLLNLQARLERDESILRMRRENFEAISARRRELAQESEKLTRELIAMDPRRRVFLERTSQTGSLQPELRNDQRLLRFVLRPEGVGAWCFGDGRRSFATIKDLSLADAVAEAVRRCTADRIPRDLFFIMDRRIYEAPAENVLANEANSEDAKREQTLTAALPKNRIPFEAVTARVNSRLPAPLFYTRLSADFLGFETQPAPRPSDTEARIHILNTRQARVYHGESAAGRSADVIAVRAPDTEILFRASGNPLFSPRQWLERERFASLAAVHVSEDAANDYYDHARLFEALRAGGAGTAVFLQTENENFAQFENSTRKLIESLESGARVDPPENDAAASFARVLAARGAASYAGQGGRVFGAAGYSLEAHRRSLQLLAQMARERGTELEENGRLEAARERYRLTLSYLWRLPGEAALAFPAELGLGRVELRLAEDDASRQEITSSLLERYDRADRKADVYDMAIETLLLVGDLSAARELSAEYVEQFPNREGDIRDKTALLEFLARLRGARYGENKTDRESFSSDYRRIYTRILGSEEAPEIARQLIRHGLYEEAGRLARDLQRRGRYRDEAEQLLFRSRAEAYLLGARSELPSPLSESNETARALRLVDLSLRSLQRETALSGDRGRAGQRNQAIWSEYDQLLENADEGESLAVSKFRQRLFTQWQNELRRHYVNSLEISDVTVAEGATAYQAVSDLERSIIYRLLLRRIEFDAELQTAQTLQALIQEERRRSAGRAAFMALGAAEAYLEREDVRNSLRFFQAFLDANDDAAGGEDRQLRAARLGVALGAGGLPASLAERKAAWETTLRQAGRDRIIEWYAGLPQTFSLAEIKAFNQKVQDYASEPYSENPLSIYAQMRAGAAILKRRAAQRENWRMLLNAAFFQQELKNYLVYRRSVRLPNPSAAAGAPQFRRTAIELFSRLPRGQNFVALVPTADAAYRISYSGGRLTHIELKTSGRFLDGRMADFLERMRTERPADDLYGELSRLYRTLFAIGQTGLTYVWLPGVHALAPIQPERGDRILQILNPEALASDRKPAKLTGEEYPGDFYVYTIGESDPQRLGDDAESRLFYERLLEMERLSLGARSQDRGLNPQHIMSDVFPLETAGLGALTSDLRNLERGPGAAPWFFSANRLSLRPETEVENFNFLIYYLGEQLEGAGILTLRMPRSFEHAYFVRSFYNRGIRERAVDRRFLAAYLALRRSQGDTVELYRYRAATASFLRETR